MSSPEPAGDFTAEERQRLLALAWRALAVGFDEPWLGIELAGLPPRLQAPGASFVTLHRGGRLRGCMGSLEHRRPLAEDVAQNARAAAYLDPRFPPLERAEHAELELSISVLTPPAPFAADSAAALLAALRPGVDGLVLEEQGRRATFLPAVWESLPQPADFLAHLLHKAGLPPDYWSPTLRFQRYEVIEIHGHAPRPATVTAVGSPPVR